MKATTKICVGIIYADPGNDPDDLSRAELATLLLSLNNPLRSNIKLPVIKTKG